MLYFFQRQCVQTGDPWKHGDVAAVMMLCSFDLHYLKGEMGDVSTLHLVDPAIYTPPSWLQPFFESPYLAHKHTHRNRSVCKSNKMLAQNELAPPAVTHIDTYTLFPKYIHNEWSRLDCLFCVGMLFADFSVASVMTHCSLTNLLALSQRDRAIIWKLPWLIIWFRRLFLALQSKHSLDVICSNTPFYKLSVGYVKFELTRSSSSLIICNSSLTVVMTGRM